MPLPKHLHDRLTQSYPEMIPLSPDDLCQLVAYLNHRDKFVVNIERLHRERDHPVPAHQQEWDSHRRFHRFLRRVLDYNHSRPKHDSGPAFPPVKPTVDSWRNLGIGLDESHNAIAFIPTPTFGTRVQKAAGVPLQLPGKRWATVLGMASMAADGHTLQKNVLGERLAEATGRRLQTGVVSLPNALADRLCKQKSDSWFSDTLADLRRELREQVAGPKEGLIVNLGVEIDLGFVVRGLVSDESRHTSFGTPPTS